MSKKENLDNNEKHEEKERKLTPLENMERARREIASWPDWKIRSMKAFFSRREKSSRYRKEKGKEPMFSG